jgi:two-component system cell cycle sensor histidine kinase PleC
MLNSTATFKEVDLIFNCDDNLTFEIDRTILPTIIRNFVSNAIKFSLDGDTIEVKCYQNGEELKISVRDEGEGMTEEVLESLFHPTKHPSKTGTNNEMGTGLGLRLSNKLAELHGGKIEVSSKEGKGSVFTLILPK